MNDRITFVMPSFGRPTLLARSVDWYTAAGGRIIVADGSETSQSFPAHADAVSDGAGSCGGVTYLHRPGREPHERIREMLVRATTPYVLFCADDDLIIPEAVDEAVRVLDSEPDCASVQGRYVTFVHDGESIEWKPAYLLSTEQDVGAADVETRLVQMFQPYHQWSYAVHRRETLMKVYDDIVPRLGLVNANLIELLVALITAVNGKARILPRFYAARESLPMSSGAITATLVDIVQDPAKSHELEVFLRAAVEHTMFAGGLDDVAAKDAVGACLSGYLDQFLPALQRSYDRSDVDQLDHARRLGGFPLFASDPALDRVTETVLGRSGSSGAP